MVKFKKKLHPNLQYGIPIWGHGSASMSHLFILQKKSIRIVFKLRARHHCKDIFRRNKILTLPSLYILETLRIVKRNPNLFSIEKTPTATTFVIRPTFTSLNTGLLFFKISYL